MIEEGIPFGERYSSAEYREWIRAQLTGREQLVVARAILDLPPARWRILGKPAMPSLRTGESSSFMPTLPTQVEPRRPRYPHVA